MLTTTVLLTACSLAATPVMLTPSAASAPTAPPVDCAAVARLSPGDAEKALVSAGFAVHWRVVRTLEDRSAVADVVTAVPEGVIVDVVLEPGLAVVFVTPPGDPAGSSPPPPAC